MLKTVENTTIPKDVLMKFNQRLATLRALAPGDPTRAGMAQRFASEFGKYPDLRQRLITAASDEIRGRTSANATLNGVIRK